MNVIFLLTIILAILMITIGGRKGVRSFFSLLLNFIVILITILLMTDESANPIILTLIASVAFSSINLLFIYKLIIIKIIAFIITINMKLILSSFILLII